MTLFEGTFPPPSFGDPPPRQSAETQFHECDDHNLLHHISEDGGDTLCVRSLVMLLNYMKEDVSELRQRVQELESLTGGHFTP